MNKLLLFVAITIATLTLYSCDDNLSDNSPKEEEKKQLFSITFDDGEDIYDTIFHYDRNEYLKSYTILDSADDSEKVNFYYDSNALVTRIEYLVNQKNIGDFYPSYKNGLVDNFSSDAVQFFYDEYNYLSKMISIEDGTSYYKFDNGNLIEYTDEEGDTYIFEYDNNKNPYFEMFPEAFGKTMNGFNIVAPSANKNNISKVIIEGVTLTYNYKYDYDGYPTYLSVVLDLTNEEIFNATYDYYE